MKRVGRTIAVLGVVGVAAAAGVWVYVGRFGGSDIERWIGNQIVGVLESYLTPQPSFANLDYQAPGTVVIDDLKLTVDDTPILAVRRVLLELAEVPRIGKPIQIERVELDDPDFRLLQRAEGGFIGWSEFVREDVQEDPSQVPEGRRLSDVLVLRHVAVRNGQIIYDDADPATQAMTLRDINLGMDTAPVEGEPGWYKLDAELKREPQFDLAVDGRIDLDNMVLELAKLLLELQLEEAQYETLPPQVQTFVREHEMKGQLSADIGGTIALEKPTTGEAELQTTLEDGRFAFGDKVLPIDEFTLTARMGAGKVGADYAIQLLGGTANGKAEISLMDKMPATADWNISGIRIEDSIRVVKEGEPPYAGILASQGQVGFDLTRMPGSLSGTGRLTMTNGRLFGLPVLELIYEQSLNRAFGIRNAPEDRAKVDFKILPNRVEIQDSEIANALITVNGTGAIYYTKHLDLEVKARLGGNVEKKLGELSNLVGTVSKAVGQLVSYTVTGTTSEPKIGVRSPL